MTITAATPINTPTVAPSVCVYCMCVCDVYAYMCYVRVCARAKKNTIVRLEKDLKNILQGHVQMSLLGRMRAAYFKAALPVFRLLL